MNRVELKTYDNSDYNPGGALKRGLWFFVNRIFFQSYLFPSSALKRSLLRFFGATIEEGVVIKPGVNIKYPWFLKVGEYTWIGEKVWIDNLTEVEIGANVCLSQGAMLLTGNHNYKRIGFDLEVKKIALEDGVWIGAKALVCPGVTCKTHAVLSAGSIATQSLEGYTVYAGNPCRPVRERIFE